MPKAVITHAVEDIDRWLQGKAERAAAIEPNRITHRLDLAAVYADRGDKAKAREQYEMIARFPVTDYNDPRYKALAEERLRALN